LLLHGISHVQIGVLTNHHSHLKAECSRLQHQLRTVAEEGKRREAQHQAEKEGWIKQRESLEFRCTHTTGQLAGLEQEHASLKTHLETLLAASDEGTALLEPKEFMSLDYTLLLSADFKSDLTTPDSVNERTAL